MRAAPGVVDAIAASDIPGKNDVGPMFPNEPVLAAVRKGARAQWGLLWNFLDGVRAVVSSSYVYGAAITYRDITSGNNGASCQSGLDLVTGRGSWVGSTP